MSRNCVQREETDHLLDIYVTTAHLDYMLQHGLVHFEGNEHSFHLHQSQHCRICNWHSAVSVSSHQVEYVPRIRHIVA